MNAEQGTDAVVVFLFEIEAIDAFDLVVNASLLHLKTSGIDEEVEFVLLALEYRAFLGDLSDALALGINQMDVGPVIGGQVFIVEARALAHEHIPRLERIGRLLVFDNFINTGVDAHHVIDVGVFLATNPFLARDGIFQCLELLSQLRVHVDAHAGPPLGLPVWL